MSKDFIMKMVAEGCVRISKRLAEDIRETIGIEALEVDAESCILLPEEAQMWDHAWRSGRYEMYRLIA